MTRVYLSDDLIRRPGPVLVTAPDGTPLAVIDPLTRQRRAVDGTLEGVLTAQGWALTGAKTISWTGHGKAPQTPLSPLERARNGRILNRDSRGPGQGQGGGRPRKARP